MAILIVEHNGTVEGASLNGRVLIGRRASNHVVVDHPDVSRIHAWIDTADRNYCVTDAGSRTGTFVNGHRVTARVALKHGDRITLGPAALTFRSDSSLPAGVSPLDFGPRAEGARDGGILFDCVCGAPLWVAANFAGRTGTCRFCGAAVVVPPPASAGVGARETVHPAAGSSVEEPRRTVATVATETCAACQSHVAVGEELTACPACGLTYHADCWTENYGCAAYGCAQANVMRPKSDLAKTAAAGDTGGGADTAGVPNAASDDGDDATASRGEPAPREYLLLAASVVAVLAGAFTFGAPALLALVAGIVLLRHPGGVRSRGVAWAAILLALAGAVAGALISYVWWLGGWSGPS